MRFHFLEAAVQELDEAVTSYESQRAGLGEEFADEVRNTIDRILKLPEAWSRLSKNVRRCRTNRFPYGIVYTVRGEDIVILAVMHLHRKPGYWKERLPE